MNTENTTPRFSQPLSARDVLPEEVSGRVTRTPHESSRAALPPSSIRHPQSSPDLETAQQLANTLDKFLLLTTEQHMTVTGAARALGRPASLFSGPNSMLARYQRGGLAAITPDRRGLKAKPGDLTQRIEALGWFIPAANFLYLNTNLSTARGSVPEAIRQTLSLPHLPTGWRTDMRTRFAKALRSSFPSLPSVELPSCPSELRAELLARERAGLPLVPDRIARQITVNAAIVKHHRSPHTWSLDTLSAPGSQRRFFNAQTGMREIMEAGDWFGGDDATPGIAVCVPCKEVLTPCSQKFGVLLGRFQWLAYNDCRTDKLLAWDYVVRPRGSYRAEDVVNGLGAVTRAHGIPRRGWQLEGGTFNALLVRHCIKLLGCEHWRTYSPHQKAIESIFNRVWTRLAVQFPHADMGRYRNENEANCALYEACKAGHKDPRHFFPTLDLIVAVFDEEMKTHNARRINSDQYGSWVPDDYFDQAIAAAPLRKFSPEMDFIFSPFAVERKIRGMMVRCRVPMFENFSVPFEFHAQWMPLHDGRKVRLHFNPRDPSATATVVLLENSGQHRADEILGTAKLIGETAGHIRLVMGWAEDDQRAGYIARQRTAQFMRRETRAVVGTQTRYSASEERDGLGQVTKIVSLSNPGDGVPNAGPANNELRAGSGQPLVECAPSEPSSKSRSATGKPQPPSQSSSRAGVGFDSDDLSARERRAEQSLTALDYV